MTLRAILIQSGTTGCVDEIDDSLEAFRRVVGGYIEHVGAADMRISLYCNEELLDMPVNRLGSCRTESSSGLTAINNSATSPSQPIRARPTRQAPSRPCQAYRWPVCLPAWRRAWYSASTSAGGRRLSRCIGLRWVEPAAIAEVRAWITSIAIRRALPRG
jgi:Domain of unknown function (DUF3846)